MSVSLSIQKVWAQDKTTIVMAVAASLPKPLFQGDGTPLPVPRKLFLILKAGHVPKIDLVTEKPEPLTPDHPMAALLRKYGLPGKVLAIAMDQHGTIGVKLAARKSAGDAYGGFVLWPGGDWSGELIWENVSLCRVGSKGVFTKAHSLDQPLNSHFYEPYSESPNDDGFLIDLLRKCVKKSGEESGSLHGAWDNSFEAQSPVEGGNKAGSGDVLPQAQRDLRDRLSRRQKTLRKALKKLEQHFPSEVEITAQETTAEGLRAHAHLWKPGADRLAMSGDENATLFIDPDKSIGSQIDEAFLEVKRLRRAREKGHSQIERAIREIAACETDLSLVRTTAMGTEQLRGIASRQGMGTANVDRVRVSKPKAQEAKSFRTFELGAGFVALVGKSAAGNDDLYRLAKGNDFFFHVVSPQGSHVIIPAKGRPPLPTEIRRLGAILAIHFSKAKQDLASEVYFTKRMNIAKKKGMAPGLVLIQRSETLHIRYEAAELDQLIKREVLN